MAAHHKPCDGRATSRRLRPLFAYHQVTLHCKCRVACLQQHMCCSKCRAPPTPPWQKQPEPCAAQALPARCDAADRTALAPPSSSPPSSSGPASAALTFEYHDCFLGRVWHVAVGKGLWHLHQIDAPLQFMQRAWWFHVQPMRTALHQCPPRACDMQAALWPAQRARVMFSLTAVTCHRLSTAPVVPSRTAWLRKTRVFSRVMAGCVSKIQVLLAAAVCALLILLTALQQTRAEYRVRYGFVLELLRHDVTPTRPRPFAGRCCCPY